MTYEETVKYILNQLPMFQRIGAPAYKDNLNNTIELMKMVDNPETKLKCVHIAGTNGKGSVSHIVASIFQEAGYKTGLYTSPHLTDFRERIKINGKKISKNYVTKFIQSYSKDFEQLKPSFFEISVALAYSYFVAQNVDYVIVETGMGGRLDSTNVINPLLSVITNIGLDHTQFLGDTIEKIAAEKAGIIKQNIPVVAGETSFEALEVFKNVAKEKNSPFYYAPQKFFFLENQYCIDGLKGNIIYEGDVLLENISCPLGGKYQIQNILTVAQSVIVLSKIGINLSKKHVLQGIENVIKNTGLYGRWQIINKEPYVVLDVAHNIDGLKQVFNQIQSITYNKLHVVYGTSDDKNLDSIIKFFPKNAEYYLCKADIPRGMSAEKLHNFFINNAYNCSKYSLVWNAYNKAISEANKNDAVLVTGSIFVVAEVLEMVDERIVGSLKPEV